MESADITLGDDTTLVYNWDNKLRTGAKGSQSSISLKYDPDGNRVWKQSAVSGQTTTRKYIVDIAAELPVTLMEIDTADSSIKKTYIYANGQILAQHNGPVAQDNQYFYLHDRLGNIREVIDSAGYVKNFYTYNPFGEVFATENTENISNPFKFTGQYYDSEIAEYYLRARQYDPHIARFTSRDPVFGQFQEPLTLHTYLYCLNDPINRTDSTGEKSLTELKATMVGYATAFGGAVYNFGARVLQFAQRVYYAAMIRGSELWLRLHGVSPTGEFTSTSRPGPIGSLTGYTGHGIAESAISHDGVGVAPSAILETVLHPVKTVVQADGTTKYIGENAVVILNEAGKLVTTWALHAAAWRQQSGG